jgi:hypothetical protein
VNFRRKKVWIVSRNDGCTITMHARSSPDSGFQVDVGQLQSSAPWLSQT